MGFSDLLLERARPIRERIFRHPFIQGIGDGTLAVEKFAFYMRQDYTFLIEYCRILALATAKGRDLATMGKFAELLHSTLKVEMDLHRSYAAEFGVGGEELERTEPTATTHGYTRHLLNVAWSGSLADIAASLLPCQWGYWELGCELAGRIEQARPNRYMRWVEAYSAPEYGELAGWVKDLVDRLAHGARPDGLASMESAFMASARYEEMFWDMAWQQQGWPGGAGN